MSSTPNVSQTSRGTTSGKAEGTEGIGSQAARLDRPRNRDITLPVGKLSRDQNLVYGSSLGPMDEYYSLGLQKHPSQEAQEVTSPLKLAKTPSL